MIAYCDIVDCLWFQWEEKLRKETLRLRIELDQINRDDKRLLLETARVEKEGELLKSKEKWDAKLQESLKEVSNLMSSDNVG